MLRWKSNLGSSKHAPEGRGSGNSRNGVTTKKLRGNHGNVEIDTPRDRNGTYEPLLVKKNQTRLTQMDDEILALYAKGMSTVGDGHWFGRKKRRAASATAASSATLASVRGAARTDAFARNAA